MASLLKTLSASVAALTFGALATSAPAFAAPKVVATIAPIHSITAAIMKDVAEPHLLVPPSASPHSTDLRPSGAKALQDADLVVWVGPRLEAFLVKPIATLAAGTKNVALIEAKGIELLPVRKGGDFEKHDHAHHDHDHDHGHDDHDKHDHDEHKDHDHDKHDHDHADHKHDDHAHEHKDDHKAHAHDDHGHEKHDHDHADHKHDHDADKHEHGDHDIEDMKRFDSHVWLSPHNGFAMSAAITKALSEIDPDNAQTYEANRKAFDAKLKASVADSAKLLKGQENAHFIVFHDAYQYFEEHFGMAATGSIMLQPGVAPGAARVKAIKEKLSRLEAACLMSEPQFASDSIEVFVEGTNTKLGQLDPLGKELEIGPDLYPNLIRYNARQLATCLNNS